MWPYVVSAAVGSASHAVTAVRIVLSSITELRRRTGLGSAQAALKEAITIHVLFILLTRSQVRRRAGRRAPVVPCGVSSFRCLYAVVRSAEIRHPLRTHKACSQTTRGSSCGAMRS